MAVTPHAERQKVNAAPTRAAAVPHQGSHAGPHCKLTQRRTCDGETTQANFGLKGPGAIG